MVDQACFPQSQCTVAMSLARLVQLEVLLNPATRSRILSSSGMLEYSFHWYQKADVTKSCCALCFEILARHYLGITAVAYPQRIHRKPSPAIK